MAAPRKSRRLRIGLIVLAIGLVITGGLFVNFIGRIQTLVQQKEPEGNPFTPPVPPLYDRRDPPMMVKLFFPGMKEDVVLSAEDQTIFRSAELTNRARQILQKLLDGPTTPGLYPSIPKDTKLQEVFVDDMGMAFVDFSSTISANHPGGMLSEQATVYPSGEDSRRRRRKGNAGRTLSAASACNGSIDHRHHAAERAGQ
jgi:hypothetical protein